MGIVVDKRFKRSIASNDETEPLILERPTAARARTKSWMKPMALVVGGTLLVAGAATNFATVDSALGKPWNLPRPNMPTVPKPKMPNLPKFPNLPKMPNLPKPKSEEDDEEAECGNPWKWPKITNLPNLPKFPNLPKMPNLPKPKSEEDDDDAESWQA